MKCFSCNLPTFIITKVLEESYLKPYEITFFNKVISNNKSDYTIVVNVIAINEVEAIKKAAAEYLSDNSIMIMNGDKKEVIENVLRLGFHFKGIKLFGD